MKMTSKDWVALAFIVLFGLFVAVQFYVIVWGG